MKKKISIITPTYNEQDNIKKLCEEISKEMSQTNYDYEHIVIDNSSEDDTIQILKDLAKINPKLKIIINARNFGHIRSPMHAILQASGDAVILLSSDFQDPIYLIPKYIQEWEKGSDVVMGQKNTSDENFFKSLIRKIFYKLIASISETQLPLNVTGAGLFDKKIIDKLRTISDPYPYFRGMISEVTKDIKLVTFHQPLRLKGKTKNNLFTLYDIAILGVVKHSKVPLRAMTFVGFCVSILSFFISLIYFFYKIIFWSSFELGMAPLLIGFFFISSIQIILLGLVGEYAINILIQTRQLPLVIEKERINFN
jgi:glycosyltransferase involved in cell wall biosynthesis